MTWIRANIVHEGDRPDREAEAIIGQAKTPFGRAAFLSEGERLVALEFLAPLNASPTPQMTLHREQSLLQPYAHFERDDRLAEIWAKRVFESRGEPVPLVFYGTAFRRRVWHALLEIPAAGTCSYAEMAARVGKPGAARAIGGAVGRNPLSWVVPCHRVIGSDGSLTGYAGGLERKVAMLSAEQDG